MTASQKPRMGTPILRLSHTSSPSETTPTSSGRTVTGSVWYSGEKSLIVPPTSGCPWPEGVFQKGAESALKAAANYAVYQEVEEKKEDEG